MQFLQNFDDKFDQMYGTTEEGYYAVEKLGVYVFGCRAHFPTFKTMGYLHLGQSLL